MPHRKFRSTNEFRRDPHREPVFVFRLYVAGATSRSNTAISNTRNFCEEHLKGRYELTVVDLYQQPQLAREAQVIAAPTLVKERPGPIRRFVGDMSDGQRICSRLDLVAD